MKVRILDAEREHYELLDDNYVQVQQGGVLPEWREEAAENHRALVDVIAEKLNLEPERPVAREANISAPVPVVPHRHAEYLTDMPEHKHDLIPHTHPLEAHDHPHEHDRALESEDIADKNLAKLENFASQLQKDFQGHTHNQLPHEHPHTHDEMLKSIAGLSEAVAEVSRVHSHAEIVSGLSSTDARVSELGARLTAHSHPAQPVLAHDHPEVAAALQAERDERIRVDAAPRDVGPHDHPHTHTAEMQAMAEQVKAEALALASAALDKASFGSLEEVQALTQRLAAHQHPHVHEDFLNEVKAVRDKLSAFQNHGHADLTAAIELTERKLAIQEKHVHEDVAAHVHPEFTELRDEIGYIRSTLQSFGQMMTDISARLLALETAPPIQLEHKHEDYALQAQLNEHLRDVNNRTTYFTAELSQESRDGKKRFIVEEAPR